MDTDAHGSQVTGAGSKNVALPSSNRFAWNEDITVQTQVAGNQLHRVRPINPNQAGPWHFIIPKSSGGLWPDYHSIYLNGAVRIKERDSNKLAEKGEGKNWSVINNFFQSLISSLWLTVNNTIFRDPRPNNYAYKSFMVQLLNITNAVKDSFYSPLDWSKDEPLGVTDTLVVGTGTVNKALNKRQDAFAASTATGEDSYVPFSIRLYHGE